MAATLTTTLANHPGGPQVRKYTLAWVAHTDGAVDLDTDEPIAGEILRVVFDPGTPAPTANYDVLLKDEHGIDVLAGLGANRHTTSTEQIAVPGVSMTDGVTTSVRPFAVSGYLNLEVTNAGSGGAGTITLYVR